MKDLIIIGAGPVGLYATFYAKLRQMNVMLIDSMPNIGGQLTALYGEKDIYDLPGYDKITANDFIDKLYNQINVNENEMVEINLNTQVTDIIKHDEYFEVVDAKNNVFKSKTVLLTIGGGLFSPRKIGIENENQFNNIYYSVSDLNKFENKDVTILGGGDSALDWALMFENIANSVNIVHRRYEYRAKEDSVQKLNESKINQYLNYTVEKLEGKDDVLEKIILKHKDTEELIEVKQDALLVNYGNVPMKNNFDSLGLNMNGLSIDANTDFSTNVEGVFACGNAIDYQGRLKLITVGLGEVPVVINAIKIFVDPSAKGKVFYSSTSK